MGRLVSRVNARVSRVCGVCVRACVCGGGGSGREVDGGGEGMRRVRFFFGTWPLYMLA